MLTLWFCEDRKDIIRAFNDARTPVGIQAEVLRTIADVDGALERMSDGDVVSIDSQMPPREGTTATPQAGEIIAAKVLDAGKRVHLVWHSKNAPLPQRLSKWSVQEQPNVLRLKQVAAELLKAGPPSTNPEAARAARAFLAGLKLDLPLMVLWVLCEGYVAKGQPREVNPQEWFAPLREVIESKPEDWQWDAWNTGAGGGREAVALDPVKKLLGRILSSSDDHPQEVTWDEEWKQSVSAAHVALNGRFL